MVAANRNQSTGRPLRDMYLSRLKKKQEQRSKRIGTQKNERTETARSKDVSHVEEVSKKDPIELSTTMATKVNPEMDVQTEVEANPYPSQSIETSQPEPEAIVPYYVSPSNSVSPRVDLLDQVFESVEKNFCGGEEGVPVITEKVFQGENDTILSMISRQGSTNNELRQSCLDPPEAQQEIEVSLENYEEVDDRAYGEPEGRDHDEINARNCDEARQRTPLDDSEDIEVGNTTAQEPQGSYSDISSFPILRSILKKSKVVANPSKREEPRQLDLFLSPTDVTSNRSKKLEPECSQSQRKNLEEVCTNMQPPTREVSSKLRVGTTVSVADDGTVIVFETDENSATDIEHGGSDTSSPIKLHKLAVPRDALDYVFECGPGDENDTKLTFEPTKPQDRDALDHLFDCGEDEETVGDQDARDRLTRSPVSPPRRRAAVKEYPYTLSLLDTATFSHEDSKSDTSRLDALRNKKREIERMVVRSNSDDPTILIPRGYKDNVIPSTKASTTSTNSTATASNDEERAIRIRVLVLASLVMGTLGAVLIFVTFNTFFA